MGKNRFVFTHSTFKFLKVFIKFIWYMEFIKSKEYINRDELV
ncbi:hypothetical protein CLOSPO_03231 [Clostridium sporogenes ATCC 15579]|nr:hypothetical protein CLOSPO_03231 [Clostridium sporogenes ATCC 15579]